MSSSYRYWRFTVLSTGDGFYSSVYELQLYDGDDTLVSEGVSVTASDENFFGGQAYQAVDGNLYYPWSTMSGELPQWIDLDLGSSVAVATLKVSYADYGQGYALAPLSFRLHGSNDGQNFTLVSEWLNQPAWTVDETRTYQIEQGPPPDPTYFVSVRVKVGGAYVAAAFNVHSELDGALVATGVTALDGSFTDVSTGVFSGSCYVVVLDDDIPPTAGSLVLTGIQPVLVV